MKNITMQLTPPYLYLLALATCLSGCSSPGSPSHLPTVWDIPSLIGGTFTEAAYDARRQRVSAYVQAHYSALREETLRGDGSHLDEAMRIAQVKPENVATVKQEFQSRHAEYFRADADKDMVVVVLIVNS
jgi:hypothetical protein